MSIVAAVCTTCFLLACDNQAAPSEGPAQSESENQVVSGSVTYLNRMALPPDAVVNVVLLDVSRADAPATIIAEKTIQSPGQVPVRFELEYNPNDIDLRMTYVVRAEIKGSDGQLLYTTDTHVPVLTRDAGSEVEIVAVPVVRDYPSDSPEDTSASPGPTDSNDLKGMDGAAKAVEERAVDERSGGMQLEGMFRYMADAPLFMDCRTGKSFPVAMAGPYIELERAYLDSGIMAGDPLRVLLRGRSLEQPAIEGNHNEITLIVDEFDKVLDEVECTPSVHAELLDTFWKLVAIDGSRVTLPADSRQIHMVLASDDSRVTGFAGCNSFFGKFQLDREPGEEQSLAPFSLTFSSLGTTRKVCPAVMETEQRLLKALNEVDQAQISGVFLELSSNKQVRLRLESVYLD